MLVRNRDSYNELYWKYKNCVVLILKQFMYKGYDESARVLSYLLEYKLYESNDGIACAGPDKEKIMNVLSAHHVNYIISEFGEITEEQSFEDNRFGIYLLASNDIVIEPYIPSDTKNSKKHPQGHSPAPPQPGPSEEIEMPEWLAPGLVVTHKIFGEGTIKIVGNSSFSVEFRNEGEKKFTYPFAFEKGFLRRVIYTEATL